MSDPSATTDPRAEALPLVAPKAGPRPSDNAHPPLARGCYVFNEIHDCSVVGRRCVHPTNMPRWPLLDEALADLEAPE